MRYIFIIICVFSFIGCSNYHEDYNLTKSTLSQFQKINNLLLLKHTAFIPKSNYEPGFDILENYLPAEISDLDSSQSIKNLPDFKYIIVHRPEFIQYVLKYDSYKEGFVSNRIEYNLIFSTLKSGKFDNFLDDVAKHQESRLSWRKSYNSNWTYVVFKEFSN